MKLRREIATDSRGRCTAILPGSQTIESKSRCARTSRAARARAYVHFPEPELPKTRTFIPPNEPEMNYREREARLCGLAGLNSSKTGQNGGSRLLHRLVRPGVASPNGDHQSLLRCKRCRLPHQSAFIDVHPIKSEHALKQST